MRCLRGRKERFAKPSYGLNCTEGSNPSLTAANRFTSTGRSVARLSRLLWEQEVASSNLAAPTYNPSMFSEGFFVYVYRVSRLENGKVASSPAVAGLPPRLTYQWFILFCYKPFFICHNLHRNKLKKHLISFRQLFLYSNRL